MTKDKVDKSKCIEAIYSDPKARKEFIALVEDEVRDTLNKVLVDAIRRAHERPSKWWEWALIAALGAFGGIGIGIFIVLRGWLGVVPVG